MRLIRSYGLKTYLKVKFLYSGGHFGCLYSEAKQQWPFCFCGGHFGTTDQLFKKVCFAMITPPRSSQSEF